eukprot:7224541-Alexandrium_andersonii.AAC.2
MTAPCPRAACGPREQRIGVRTARYHAGGAFRGARGGGRPPGEQRRKAQKPAENCVLQFSAAFCA